jgi:hypothetical protein
MAMQRVHEALGLRPFTKVELSCEHLRLRAGQRGPLALAGTAVSTNQPALADSFT